jgi:integrase
MAAVRAEFGDAVARLLERLRDGQAVSIATRAEDSPSDVFVFGLRESPAKPVL